MNQNSDHPGDYWSNSRANVGRPRISAKSLAEQLGISLERVVFIIHERLDMRVPSAKWVPKCLNVDQKRQRCQSSEKIWNFFRQDSNDLCRDWLPWTKPVYITMTRRQSNNQWSGVIAAHPAPKIPSSKFRWKISSLIFFGIKTSSSSLRIFQRSKLSTRSISHLCWCNWRSLMEKRHGKVTKVVLFLHDNAPAHRALATQKKLAHMDIQCLDHRPYSSDLAPSDYHLIPELKNSWKYAIYRRTRRSLLPRRSGWTDNFLIFFEWLAKVGVTE